MINKFQQGGKLQEAIMLFVLGIAQVLLADTNQVILIAQQNPDALEAAVQTYLQTQDINQAAQTFLQTLQKKTQVAKHGAKLSYIKSLKNQCAEDEELYYYKKGGSVDCGCKKKENGGEIEKNSTAIDKFKVVRKAGFGDVVGRIADATGSQGGFKRASKEKTKEKLLKKPSQPKPASGPKNFKNDYSSLRVKDSEKDYLEGTADHKVKKDCGGSKMKLVKKGDKVCPKCGKVHAAGMGCAVAKFKMHKLGGSLNGIPFYLKGTNGGGIEKSDNTRVQKIPNNGEGVYEMTPQGVGDFLPLVGTYRAAQRIDRGEPNASYGDLIMNGAMDLLGVGMVGPVIKAAGKANRIHKVLKNRGFTQITKEPTHWVRTPKYITRGLGNKLYSWQIPFTEPAIKVIPNVNYTNVAMLPLIQSLRVPATAPFK